MGSCVQCVDLSEAKLKRNLINKVLYITLGTLKVADKQTRSRLKQRKHDAQTLQSASIVVYICMSNQNGA